MNRETCCAWLGGDAVSSSSLSKESFKCSYPNTKNTLFLLLLHVKIIIRAFARKQLARFLLLNFWGLFINAITLRIHTKAQSQADRKTLSRWQFWKWLMNLKSVAPPNLSVGKALDDQKVKDDVFADQVEVELTLDRTCREIGDCSSGVGWEASRLLWNVFGGKIQKRK